MTLVPLRDKRAVLFKGDCLDLLKNLPANSIDACVTDPPYGLEFMGKEWDGADGFRRTLNQADTSRPSGHGRLSRTSPEYKTTKLFYDFTLAWATEVLRVLKPGGHLLSFGGTRTYHRMACAVEDAGFEIRDQVQWLYGQGFPKSLDISKAFDKAAGAEREVLRERYTVKRINPGATVVANGEWGKQELPYTATDSAPATALARQWEGWGTALKPACEPIVLARKPLEGTVIQNVEKWGVGGLNIEASRVGTTKDVPASVSRASGTSLSGSVDGTLRRETGAESGHDPNIGRWPANVIHDGSEEVIAAFPNAPGQLRSVGPEHGVKAAVNVYGDYGPREDFQPRLDQGSAARFFYQAKATSKERNGSKHPTVKPLALMRYLVRLVTPPDGWVLDPFGGTGTTAEAAVLEGFRTFIAERDEIFQQDIIRRLDTPPK